MSKYETKGSFGTDGNWATAGNWSAGVPIATEDVMIGAITNAIVGSDQSLVATGDLFISSACELNIGSAGTPLQLDPTDVYYEGSCPACYIDATITGETYAAHAGKTDDALVLNGVNAGTITRLHCLRGRTTLGGACTATALHIKPVSSPDVIVDLDPGATATTTYQEGGLVNFAGTSTTWNMSGGFLTQSAGTITTIEIAAGGIFKITSGTATTINLHKGVLDLTQTTGVVTATTINVWNGIINEGATKPDYASSITVNYLGNGPHKRNIGDTDTLS